MISFEMLYNAVNALLVVTGLVSFVLVFKVIRDGRSKKILIAAFLLIIISGILMPVCLKYYRLGPVANLADSVGNLEKARNPEKNTGPRENMREQVSRFKDIALLGYLSEAVAIALLAVTTKRLVSFHTAELPKEEAKQ